VFVYGQWCLDEVGTAVVPLLFVGGLVIAD
jgi:hypothetical protein